MLNGNEGADWLQGGAGNDTLLGGHADDILWGDVGDDRLFGNHGADHLTGNQGNDRLIGGNGNDSLDGGLGNDVLVGGKGVDEVILSYDTARTDLVLNAQDNLRWRFDSTTGSWVSGTSAGHNHLRFWADRDGDGIASAADEFDYVSSAEKFTIQTGSGDDVITGGVQDDQLSAGQGNDILDGGDGIDLAVFVYDQAQNNIRFDLDGAMAHWPTPKQWRFDETTDSWVSGSSDAVSYRRLWSDENGNGLRDEGDQIDYFTSIERVSLETGSGHDRLIGGAYDDVLIGGAGKDDLYGLGGDDSLVGGKGQDVLVGGDGDDRLEGGGGKDSLYGDRGDDVLIGGDGDDYLFDGDGDDIMTGGAGADKFFVWQNVSHRPFDFETNIITDFNSEEGDRLVFDTASGTETSISALNLSIRGPFEDVTWVTNFVGNTIYASLVGVNFRDVTEDTFDQYFEVI